MERTREGSGRAAAECEMRESAFTKVCNNGPRALLTKMLKISIFLKASLLIR